MTDQVTDNRMGAPVGPDEGQRDQIDRHDASFLSPARTRGIQVHYRHFSECGQYAGSGDDRLLKT